MSQYKYLTTEQVQRQEEFCEMLLGQHRATQIKYGMDHFLSEFSCLMTTILKDFYADLQFGSIRI